MHDDAIAHHHAALCSSGCPLFVMMLKQMAMSRCACLGACDATDSHDKVCACVTLVKTESSGKLERWTVSPKGKNCVEIF